MSTMFLNEYAIDLNEKRMNSHRAALKHFPVRYSSFDTAFSKDCLLPACTLAQYGFHYDSVHKLIRCVDCQFEYTNLGQALLTTIMHKHHKYKADCAQLLLSLENFLEGDEDLSRPRPHEICGVELLKPVNRQGNVCYQDLENRLRSFDNIRLAFDKRTLAENGFYRVLLKDTLRSKKVEKTEIDKISRHVPSLMHIKCAFCTYECLISKEGRLNTIYKSPLKEHQEKSSNTCLMFTSNKQTTQECLIEDQLDWLRNLLELDTRINAPEIEDQIGEILLKNKEETRDDLILKQIPHAIDQLILLENTKKKNILYTPQKLSDFNKLNVEATSDFEKLQNVLSLSDNVISEKAYHPAFKMHHVRLESFKCWPSGHTQQPKDLARAGFYYFGVKDMVKCFFCNGGLRDWTPGDDPYQDHVRWFPKCQFIRQLMGPEYVEQIREKYKNKDSGFTDETLVALSATSTTTSTRNADDNLPTKKSCSNNLNSLLDTNLMRSLIRANITNKDLIQQTIEKYTPSCPNQTTFDTVKLALELDQAAVEQKEKLKEISDFMVCNLMPSVSLGDMKALVSFQFGVVPLSVRILREYGSFKTRCIALVCLHKRDHHVVDKIVHELGQKYFLPNKTDEQVQVFKTNWNEVKERAKEFFKPRESNNSSENNLNGQKESEEKSSLKCDQECRQTPASSTGSTSSEIDLKKSTKLKEENERLKSERLCVVCLSKDKNILFLPCAHLAACLDCSFNMQNCPLCRSTIQATVRTYS